MNDQSQPTAPGSRSRSSIRNRQSNAQSQTTASVYYAVGYSNPRGIGFDIGEFDSFGDAVAAAIEYGAWPTEVIDAAEMTFKIGEDGEIIWIQRWKNGRAE